MTKLRILVTGSNGLIGRTFIETYKKNYKIFKYTKRDNLDKILKISKPEIIFNTAGEQYNEKRMISSNLLIVEKLLNFCRKRNSYLISLGSSAEYGVCKFPTKENTLLKPATKYEATKAAASMLITGYSKAYDLNAIVVRPYAVYGVYNKPDRLIPKLINCIKKNGCMNIYRGYHDFIYVKDFVRGIKILIENRHRWERGEVINLGSGKQLSNFQVLQFVKEIFGNKKGKFNLINKFFRKWDSNMWVCNPAHINKKYGFRTKFTFKKSLVDMKEKLAK